MQSQEQTAMGEGLRVGNPPLMMLREGWGRPRQSQRALFTVHRRRRVSWQKSIGSFRAMGTWKCVPNGGPTGCQPSIGTVSHSGVP